GLDAVPVSTRVWLPAGFEQPTDAPGIEPFTIRVSDLDAQDWADILGTNLVRDPQGIALADAFYHVTQTGWTDRSQVHPARGDYTIRDLIDRLDYLRNDPHSDHAPQTLRALIRTLEGYSKMPLFTGQGTPLNHLLREGVASVLMLPLRVGHD